LFREKPKGKKSHAMVPLIRAKTDLFKDTVVVQNIFLANFQFDQFVDEHLFMK
jgi:hypothetical protein